MDKLDDADLLRVATRISDDAEVDWTQLPTPRDEASASVMRELALLDRIAGFHRAEATASTTPTGPAPPRTSDAADVCMWGHFRLINKVGEGTFGVVYRAWDTKLESEVALKLLAPGSDRSATALHEARLMARVQHPNVVRVFGTDLIDGRVGIWMEFVKGRNLTALLNSQGPLGAREAAEIGVDLCRALGAVHGAELMHGDLKAHNVMREAGGRTVLMDFGTGKDLDADRGTWTTGDDFAGTPLYIAPEVFDGQPRSRRGEIYSLGVLLYHLVTNAYPVDGRSRKELQEAHVSGHRKHLRDARPDLPQDFVYVVERALSVNPQERYASAGEFEAALARFLSGGPEPEPWRWPSIAAILFATAALALAIGTGYWLRPSQNSGSGTTTPAAGPQPAASAAAGAAGVAGSPYQIDTALYRARGALEERLHPGERVSPGDGLFVKLRVTIPAYVYIVNEDDQGETFLLFPMTDQAVPSPVSAGTTNRIPADYNWQVTSVGGREHFLIFASPERMPAFEQMFAALPRPELQRTPRAQRMPEDTVRRLRSVGGLMPVSTPPPANAKSLAQIFKTPLGDSEETAQGLWVRQLTLTNPK